MFQCEYEKRPQSHDSRSTERDSRATGRDSRMSMRDWHSRPLPPRPEDRLPAKTSVPLKVWVIASASCFGVCGALVLATVVITRSAASDTYTSRGLYAEAREPLYPMIYPQPRLPTTTEGDSPTTHDSENDLNYPILEKLSIFKNIVANRDKKKIEDLVAKPQIHPLQDMIHHPERKIEKKDKAKLPDHPNLKTDANKPYYDFNSNYPSTNKKGNLKALENDARSSDYKINRGNLFSDDLSGVPEFKPTLPDVFMRDNTKLSDGYVGGLKKVHDDSDSSIKLSDGYIAGLKRVQEDNYEEYYDDNNLYDDYIQSNSMTSYLIEKVQELHDWIVTDPDFDAKALEKRNSSKSSGNEFGQLLKALNESLIEGNITIVMVKLRELYLGENFTQVNQTRKVILSNSTNLLSFGILTLDVMLLHNIQLMAWESQETARNKMLKDPDVFAFNALFMEPSKVEAKRSELYQKHDGFSKRQSVRQDTEESDFGKNLLENVLEIGMGTARAAIHLGRAFKNTKMVLTQLSNREQLNANIQSQISRNIDANTHALNHLRTSYNKNDSSSAGVANATGGIYTDLDCVWLLYCKNLVATAKLNAPYGTMARINGLALRMLTGEVPADRALDVMLYEVLTGWTELRCTDMFPRCSKANPATVVLESILQPLRKSQSTSNRL